MTLLDLEAAIKDIPGVLGCVILSEADDTPSEIQAFIRVGVDRAGVQEAIRARSDELGVAHLLDQILVFELETESLMGGPDSLKQAELLAELGALSGEEEEIEGARPAHRHSEAGRPVLRRVVSLTTTWRSEAEVSLGDRRREVVGQAVGSRKSHGLEVLAQATIDAVHQLWPEEHLRLVGTWLTRARDREVVLVFVEKDGLESVGAALVKDRPLTDAAVRATLDAVNRRLSSSGGERP